MVNMETPSSAHLGALDFRTSSPLRGFLSPSLPSLAATVHCTHKYCSRRYSAHLSNLTEIDLKITGAAKIGRNQPALESFKLRELVHIVSHLVFEEIFLKEW